jgi:hypothetical protein
MLALNPENPNTKLNPNPTKVPISSTSPHQSQIQEKAMPLLNLIYLPKLENRRGDTLRGPREVTPRPSTRKLLKRVT